MIDWTWDVPSVAVCVLLAAAVLTTRALDAAGAGTAAAPGAVGACRRRSSRSSRPAFAIPAIWAGAVLAVASDRLDASDEALAAGRLDEAATAARSAAAAEPWSAEPWLQLATIEQAAGNLEAARLDARRAIDLTPADFRPWLLTTIIETSVGNYQLAYVYGSRAVDARPADPRAGRDRPERPSRFWVVIFVRQLYACGATCALCSRIRLRREMGMGI